MVASHRCSALRLCHGTKNVLHQFVTWYEINQSIIAKNPLSLDDVFVKETLYDVVFLDRKFVNGLAHKLSMCIVKNTLSTTKSIDEIVYARFNRGLSVFTSRAYSRSGHAVNFYVAINNPLCQYQPNMCFAEVLFFVDIDSDKYAFVRAHLCTKRSITAGLSCSVTLKERMDRFYRFFDDRHFSYELVPVSHVLHKVIRLPVLDEHVFCFTCVYLDFEHD